MIILAPSLNGYHDTANGFTIVNVRNYHLTKVE